MYKNSKKNILLPILIALGVVVGIFIGIYILPRTASTGDLVVPRKLRATLSLMEKAYVDPIDMDSVTEKVLPLLVRELDPHSVYIPAKEFAAVNESLDGEFDGIGVVFNMLTDTVVVLNVISGGPSDKAGVKNGDRIITIDDSTVAGRKVDQNAVMKMLRGKRGTKVNLGIQRAAITGLVPITVTRDVISVKSVNASFMISPGIGYIKLLTFSRNSYAEMTKSLSALREEGMSKLIFDLRGNTGGFLDQAIMIANEFLQGRELIVYTVDRNGKRVEEYSDGRGKYTDIGLVMLIDEGSASSSEILAGAIQDNDRGTIIGRRSFGKGLVQQQFPFADGSALRLTIARYYTPTGRSIQKPYRQGDEEDYGNDIANRYRHNEFFSADSIHFDDSQKFTTPAGKTVYGGGGIMPDVFVPLDTTEVTKFYIEVAGRNILYKYTLQYSDRHRRQLDAVTSVPELKRLMDSDRNLYEDFLAYARRNGVNPTAKEIEESRKLITAQLRAYIGRNTPLDDTGFYSLIWPEDNVVLKALEVLK